MLENFFVVDQKSYMSYHIYLMLAVKMGEALVQDRKREKQLLFLFYLEEHLFTQTWHGLM